MGYIFFSRNRPPHPLQGSAIMAGVIEADTPEAGKDKFAKLLTSKSGILTDADDFDYLALEGVERTPHGVLAITIREA